MQLGLLVPKNMLIEEIPILKKRFSFISMHFFPYSSVFNIPSLLAGKQKELDYLLFFGKTTMNYTTSKITPTIPWDIIPRTNASLLQLLFKAALNGHNVYKIATDIPMSEREILHDAYQEAGIDSSKITITYAPPYTFDETFSSHMKEYYYRCRQQQKDVTCITIFSDVYRQLKAEHFPILFLFTSLPDICNSIQKTHADFLLQASRESQLVIIYAAIDEINDYSPLTADEYQMTLENLNVAKYIYAFAQKIQGAVFPVTEREFLIFSTRSIIENKTDKFHRFSLIEEIQKNTASTISVGIGFGKTALEAKHHARIGVKRAWKSGGNQLFLVYDKNTVRGPINPASDPSLNISDHFLSISSKTGISAFTLGQIHKIITEHGKNEFTASEISDLLNISARSISRTILKLMDAGYCFEVGRKFQHQGGRPSRILRFTL
ncbi:hypothetical protein AB840_12560 [Megasphaera cerevisiae DSM 20462]|uniref:Transcriptional regulator n=2 Tax=Megasphaera TaxID=906 RepID=A0A0J6ZLA6_9FIRM|nr:HTH domain-containing protein [Megasphaera cerevisiae]KMO85631.1 hypothetical protein AB840_12560 [Megasphaera cerevisiae DSM 20462]MCI1749813.1 HTH domain-containing protein [Megasphaera cerevisiae]SKA09618.1 Predicted signaling protein consisting of a modified GGDEF domain and a DHH domain [Megasphaera cerevisiae DSM 20462]